MIMELNFFDEYAITTMLFPLGYILGKRSCENRTKTANLDCWETNATFQNVTIWNHDAMPSKDDAFVRAFHWFTAANAVSSLFLLFPFLS